MEFRPSRLDANLVDDPCSEIRTVEEVEHIPFAEKPKVSRIEETFAASRKCAFGEREDYREMRHVRDRSEDHPAAPQMPGEDAQHGCRIDQVLEHVGGNDYIEIGGQLGSDFGDVSLEDLVALRTGGTGRDGIDLHPGNTALSDPG